MRVNWSGREKRPQVTFRVIGGLGNQLFQFSHAYAVSQESGLEVNLDVSAFATYKGNEGFLLERLVQEGSSNTGVSLNVGELSSVTSNALRFGRGWRWLIGSLFRFRIFWELRPFEFRKFELMSGKKHLFIGFWQSWRFFEGQLDEIRKMCRGWLGPEEVGQRLRRQIGVEPGRDLVMVHVRRGDYLKHSDTYTYLSAAYYSTALDAIVGVAKDPVFLVFSDEPNRVRDESIFEREVIYFDDSGLSSKDVLASMVACDYFVTANSTFSWWAAFLGCPEGGFERVVVPSLWLKSGESVDDLVFDYWIKVTPEGERV